MTAEPTARLDEPPADPVAAELTARLDEPPADPVAGEISDPAPIPADLAAPPTPHLALVRDDDAVGGGAFAVPDKSPQRKRGTKPGSARRLRWATPIAIAAGFVAFVGFGLDYLAGRSGESKNQSVFAESRAGDDSGSSVGAAARASGDFPILTSGTNYTAETLPEAPAAQTLSNPGMSDAAKAPPGGAMDSEQPLVRLRDPSALQQCLDEIQVANGGAPITVQSVDFARFDGAPAVIVRFSAAGDVRVWASGPACGTPSAGADTLHSAPVR